MAHYTVALLLAVLVSGTFADNYVTKYDNVNLEEIFNSERLMDNYMNCLKNVGSCTPDGRELKNNLPDALMNDCVKCSEKQRDGSDKVIKFIIANRPGDFAILEQMYDPTGEYRRKYLQLDGSHERINTEADDSPSSSGDGAIGTEPTHATEHNSSASQDHDQGEGRTDMESEN